MYAEMAERGRQVFMFTFRSSQRPKIHGSKRSRLLHTRNIIDHAYIFSTYISIYHGLQDMFYEESISFRRASDVIETRRLRKVVSS